MLQGKSSFAGESKESRRFTLLRGRSFGDPREALCPSDKLTVWTKPKVVVLICNIIMISRSSGQRIAALDAPKRGQYFVCLVWFAKLQCCGPNSAVNRDGTSLPFICLICSPTVDGVRCFVQGCFSRFPVLKKHVEKQTMYIVHSLFATQNTHTKTAGIGSYMIKSKRIKYSKYLHVTCYL